MTTAHETVFTLEATPIKYGSGAVADAGWELARLGVRRAFLVTDPGLAAQGIPDRVQRAIEAEGIAVVRFDRARVEPTIGSLQEAADAALAAGVDGVVSVGGGSSIDTGKVAALVVSEARGRSDDAVPPIIDYVNAPVGGGRAPSRPLLPHLAIPTTSGSGSEATTVAVLDLPELRVKSGISHRYLRPAQGIVDPDLTRTLPGEVVSATGLDVVCHAAESFLSQPFDRRPRPAGPADRPPYQGANPVADVWSAKALELGGRYLRRAVADADDLEARGAMMLSATMAGVGFGSAGVHIPHACAYPIAGLKHVHRPAGYPDDHPFVPHGHAVIVTAPAAFRFTYEAMPERHHQVAGLLLGLRVDELEPAGHALGPELLPTVLRQLMTDVGAPSGIGALGYDEQDVPALVEGALKQQRLLQIAPRQPRAEDLAEILLASR
ncbi:hydroxyacid-oxoacid transhydrogenase [Patulibacter defluvii]|uniref:hydroxyacid-oxoacid transhydrogenase n=1 Tax=Patulibacter defluvii TaxID=3095358 RepID=UPI002A74F942|nr:hydroxyacid-oxoacid transhydrogenase [Patulibacter sp. DM4]